MEIKWYSRSAAHEKTLLEIKSPLHNMRLVNRDGGRAAHSRSGVGSEVKSRFFNEEQRGGQRKGEQRRSAAGLPLVLASSYRLVSYPPPRPVC